MNFIMFNDGDFDVTEELLQCLKSSPNSALNEPQKFEKKNCLNACNFKAKQKRQNKKL